MALLRFSSIVIAAGAVLALVGCSQSSGSGGGIDPLGSIGRAGNGASQTATGTLVQADVAAYVVAQEKELREILNGSDAKVERAGDQLVVVISSPALFGSRKDQVRPQGEPMIKSIAGVLNKYGATTVEVYGHTDSGGQEKANLDLTQRRALAVAKSLAKGGVDAKRLSVTGFGSERPLAPNDTETGRAANRRLEIQISPVVKT